MHQISWLPLPARTTDLASTDSHGCMPFAHAAAVDLQRAFNRRFLLPTPEIQGTFASLGFDVRSAWPQTNVRVGPRTMKRLDLKP